MSALLTQFPEWDQKKTTFLGVICWSVKVKKWRIQATPDVIVWITRLFPSAETPHRGEVWFRTTWRNFTDLCVILHRYPLKWGNDNSEEEFGDQWMRAANQRKVIEAAGRNGVPSINWSSVISGELRKYQVEGVNWCNTYRRTLLADDMGLGKSVQALAAFASQGAFPLLICCPSQIMTQWVETVIPQWLPGMGGRVYRTVGQQGRRIPEGYKIVVTGYHLLQYWQRPLEEWEPHGILWDEIQELRHHTGNQKWPAARAIVGSAGADMVIGTSGTPIYNYADEMWAVMSCIEPSCLGEHDHFRATWCGGSSSGAVADPEALGAFLRREGLMLRRLKTEVAKDLPKKSRLVEQIDSDQSAARQFLADAIRARKASRQAMNIKASTSFDNSAIALLRQATGVAKAAAVGEFVASIADTGRKVVVFVHHHEVTRILLAKLSKFCPVCITGDENDTQKTNSKALFCDPSSKTRVIIISLRSGTGIDKLQNVAQTAVFAELDYSPAVLSQCEDRLHRIGQNLAVDVYYLVTSFGADPSMQAILGLKRSQFMGLTGDPWEDEEAEEINKAEMRRRLLSYLDQLAAAA